MLTFRPAAKSTLAIRHSVGEHGALRRQHSDGLCSKDQTIRLLLSQIEHVGQRREWRRCLWWTRRITAPYTRRASGRRSRSDRLSAGPTGAHQSSAKTELPGAAGEHRQTHEYRGMADRDTASDGRARHGHAERDGLPAGDRDGDGQGAIR